MNRKPLHMLILLSTLLALLAALQSLSQPCNPGASIELIIEEELFVGGNYTVAGRIVPNPGEGRRIRIVYISPIGSRITHYAVTDTHGMFADEFAPDMEGDWEIVLLWEGAEGCGRFYFSRMVRVSAKAYSNEEDGQLVLAFLIMTAAVALLAITITMLTIYMKREKVPPWLLYMWYPLPEYPASALPSRFRHPIDPLRLYLSEEERKSLAYREEESEVQRP